MYELIFNVFTDATLFFRNFSFLERIVLEWEFSLLRFVERNHGIAISFLHFFIFHNCITYWYSIIRNKVIVFLWIIEYIIQICSQIREVKKEKRTRDVIFWKKNRMSSILLLKNSGFRGFLIRFLSFCDFEQKSKDNDVFMLNQTTVARFRNDIIFRKIEAITFDFDDFWFYYCRNRCLKQIFFPMCVTVV